MALHIARFVQRIRTLRVVELVFPVQTEVVPVPASMSQGAGQCTTVMCHAGQYMLGVTCLSCPRGTYSNAGAVSCTPCPAGETSGPGSGSCTP
ncbi:hypothetical protein RSOLAG1IB_08688 [Rhizoctonia solani AG-1 IB]|uniref:Tyrosine-protein kinase ephrin type A/B receptor-like domain-containing protein n=1 Tax=Thanatephorus cucumeris (strain AG1-IB / isolate 7/3/14) TaxID=1108050 RepID=A0A0B7FR42_THACB|nr:hypothetical protein RSOLAG1IB_08688 [Rhizoctonia solani AG-1 IB]